jgi:cytochrome P450
LFAFRRQLYWAFFALAKNPDVQDRLYQDIKEHAAGADPIGVQHIAKMAYLQAFLQEVLRLYPPVGLIARANASSEEFAGFTIPAGTRLVVPIHLLHRHPLYWDDPETFQPERWINVSDAEQERRRFAFLPFSTGGRNCIGHRFATLEAQLILAPIVRTFLIRIAPSQRDTNHTFTTFITMKTKPGLKIVVQDRSRAVEAK